MSSDCLYFRHYKKDTEELGNYRGDTFQGEPHGVGILDQRGQIVYAGNWENGKYCGFGCLYDANGRLVYKGHFRKGKFHGVGTFYKKSTSETALWFEGEKMTDID